MGFFGNEQFIATLPLGISFYTFTQIGFLIDQFQGSKKESKIINYSFFVTFFPSVTSGPILEFDSIRGQIIKLKEKVFNIDLFTRGFCLLLIGLFKKVILAAYAATISNAVYSAIDGKVLINSLEAWLGAISYSLQLYFDFSGYTDIAIGIGWMIGINLPWNFNSPYKASNIVEFWRRWHMSLSNWLNNYIFEPINYSITKKVKNTSFSKNAGLIGYLVGTLLTMSLCGLWHGATSNFILWGLFHVVLIFINRFWNIFFSYRNNSGTSKGIKAINLLGNRLLTFIFVTFSWVLFRSIDFDSTMGMWKAMVGINGIYVPEILLNKFDALGSFPFSSNKNYLFTESIQTIFFILSLLLAIVFLLPNSKEIMTNSCSELKIPVVNKVAKILKLDNGWNPSISWIILMSIMLIALFTWSKVPDFLYFNF
jgi:D-alanyl-lipoteichoic acid acyltransferase DltB (MBOAT superfamily)